MTPNAQSLKSPPADQLLQYASTVNAMHKALHRIFANKKAISDSLTRTATALRRISNADDQKKNTITTK